MDISSIPGSAPTVSGKMQLFQIPPTDMSMKEKRFLEFVPTSDNISPAEFVLPASDTFIDLNRSFFTATLRLQKAGGGNIGAADKLFPVINLIHSMIKQFTVQWNGVLLNAQTDTYALRAYMATLLNYTGDEASTLLAPEGWWRSQPSMGYAPIDAPVPLTADNIDNTTPHEDYNALSSEKKAFVLGMHEEKKKFEGGVWNTFYFKPMHEIFHSGQLTPPGIEQKYQFTFQNPEYYINGPTAEAKAKPLHKDDFKLRFYMCVVMIDPPLYKKITAARHTQRQTVKLATTRSELRVFTLSANVREFNEGNLFQGRIPQRMMVGLLHPDSFNGSPTYHPFAFQKFGVQTIKQLVHGEEYPYRTLELVHDSNEKDMAGYFRFLEAGGFLARGEAPMITQGMWGTGRNCTLFVWDNTANGLVDGPLMNPKQRGDVRLLFTLGGNVGHTINVCVFAQFESVLAADPNGAILYDIYS